MFGKRIGIDLGTANVLVYVKGSGVILDEPSVVAMAENDGKILAVGNEARAMLGRTPGSVIALRPMRGGVIADYYITEAMLEYFIAKACGPIRLFKPEVMVCIPAGVTSVERRAVHDATLQAGARVVYLIEEPRAAAIGARMPIHLPGGHMILDIGGGTTEAAVISLNDIVYSSSVRIAGDKFDEAILSYVRRKYNLLIGERTAEEIKIRIGSAQPLEQELKMDVRGRDQVTGLPKTISISSVEVREALHESLAAVMGVAKQVLEQTPPELAADIIDRGIVLVGGGALLRGIDQLLTEALGVPCYVAETPLACVAIGAGLALERVDLLRRTLPSVES
ncbi:MAG: rod shape-determining protein [Chloroflexi bacterium]|nr:rod shape-determining protein [Chloroflexota bacterium]